MVSTGSVGSPAALITGEYRTQRVATS